MVLIVLDQLRREFITRFDMDNVQELIAAGVSYRDAYLGHMASETVVSHNVMTSGMLPKHMGWSDEWYRDADGVLGPVGAHYVTGSMSVDQFDALGLGQNVPINTGNGSEGLLALKDGKWVVLRVPYPLGFYTKWMDGRIDDPRAGWKGRGLWATVSTRAPFHMEGGKGTTSKVVRFQLRPDPLAR